MAKLLRNWGCYTPPSILVRRRSSVSAFARTSVCLWLRRPRTLKFKFTHLPLCFNSWWLSQERNEQYTPVRQQCRLRVCCHDELPRPGQEAADAWLAWLEPKHGRHRRVHHKPAAADSLHGAGAEHPAREGHRRRAEVRHWQPLRRRQDVPLAHQPAQDQVFADEARLRPRGPRPLKAVLEGEGARVCAGRATEDHD